MTNVVDHYRPSHRDPARVVRKIIAARRKAVEFHYSNPKEWRRSSPSVYKMDPAIIEKAVLNWLTVRERRALLGHQADSITTAWTT